MAIENKVAPFPQITDETAAAAAPAFAHFEKTVETLKHAAAGVMNAEKVQAQMKEGVDRMMKTAEHMMSLSQGNLDAMMKSGQIVATGMQDLSRSVAGTAQASFEEMTATFKAFSTVKSMKEAMELQAGFARGLMEKMMAESGKLTDHTMKLTEQASAPLTARLTVAMETLSPRA